MRKTLALVCLSLLIGGGCAKKAVPVVYVSSGPADKESTRSYVTAQMAVSPMNMGAALGSVSAASRYLAVRQELVVVAPGAELAKSAGSGDRFLRDAPRRRALVEDYRREGRGGALGRSIDVRASGRSG